MRERSSGHAASGLELLTIAFIVLKLCKVIDWSWIWVLSPIWIVVALIILLKIIRAVLGNRGKHSDDVHV